MRPSINKPHIPPSSFWSSSLNLVLFLVIPLVVFLVLVSALTPEPSTLSPWTWRFGNLVSHSFGFSPPSLIEETPTNISDFKAHTNNSTVIKGSSIFNGSSTDSSFLDAEPDYFASNRSFSAAFIEKETVQLVRISFSLKPFYVFFFVSLHFSIKL